MKAEGKDKNYKRVTLRNTHTGEPEEVHLFDPQDEANEGLLAVDAHLELKADLKAALETFTKREQLIILRVLLQGQSVEQATKLMKGSLRSWSRWLYEDALPRLRSLLEDYEADIRELPYSPSLILPAEEKPDDEEKSLKCKFCPHTEMGKGERPFNRLRIHVSEKHPQEYTRAYQHVRERDYELDRAREDFV